LGVINRVKNEIADAFRNAHSEIQSRLGNPFVAIDQTGATLPSGFVGLAKEQSFSNYVNRVITTDQDVSYIQENFYVAHSGEETSRLRVWRIAGKYAGGERIGTRVFTTSLEPEAQILLTSNGLFAV
jgi:hypothetical protein